MTFKRSTLITVLALALIAVSGVGTVLAQADLVDAFDTIDPAWVTDRYAPAGFDSVMFDGDNRLMVSISDADSAANRPSGYSSTFYNTQGRQRPMTSAPQWCVIGQVYVSADMISGNNLRRTGLWARTGQVGTETGADYFMIDIKRFDDADAFNPAAANITSTWRVWDSDTGWEVVSAPLTVGWHDLRITSTGTEVQYYIDNVLVNTDDAINTTYPNLTTIFINSYNFGAGDYQVYWDNVGSSCTWAPPSPEEEATCDNEPATDGRLNDEDLCAPIAVFADTGCAITVYETNDDGSLASLIGAAGGHLMKPLAQTGPVCSAGGSAVTAAVAQAVATGEEVVIASANGVSIIALPNGLVKVEQPGIYGYEFDPAQVCLVSVTPSDLPDALPGTGGRPVTDSRWLGIGILGIALLGVIITRVREKSLSINQ